MIDSEKLQTLAQSDSCAKALFEQLSKRQRNSPKTTKKQAITILETAGHEFRGTEVIEVFKQLQTLGCGDYLQGRRGWPTRFEWSAEMISVAAKALGGETQIEVLDESESDIDWLLHSFHIRPNVEIEVQLPMDVTGNEVNRLAQFVSSLSFEEMDFEES